MNVVSFKKEFHGPCLTVSDLVHRRASITALGKRMEQLDDSDKIEFPVTHRFADNVYIREIFIPKGSCIIGKIHKTQFFNILVSGTCLLASTDGVKLIGAPYTSISEPGSQKCAIALTDVLWQTVHATTETNPVKLVDDLTVDNYDDLEVDVVLNNLIGAQA